MDAHAKATLLRAMIGHVHAHAAEIAAATCAAAGVDPAGPLIGAAWLTGPIALLANARCFAEAFESPSPRKLSRSALKRRMAGRVSAQLPPGSFVERRVARGPVTAVFRSSSPVEVLAEQGSSPPAEGTRDLETDAIRALRVAVSGEGPVALVASPAHALAFAPLADAGLVRLVDPGATTVPPARGVAMIVPALYAKDELSFMARRLAAEIGAGILSDTAPPHRILVASCWLQREMFVDRLRDALVVLGDRAPSILRDISPSAAEISVIGVGCDDPAELLRLAAAHDSVAKGPPDAVEIIVHIVHEEDPAVAPVLEREIVGMPSRIVGVNEWPAIVSFRGEGPSSARKLVGVDKTIVRGPLEARPPLYFLDARHQVERGARLAHFHAYPSLGAGLRA